MAISLTIDGKEATLKKDLSFVHVLESRAFVDVD